MDYQHSCDELNGLEDVVAVKLDTANHIPATREKIQNINVLCSSGVQKTCIRCIHDTKHFIVGETVQTQNNFERGH